MRAPRLALLAFAVLVLLTGVARAATPQTTLPDVEDEVMCPTCGTLLLLAESQQANDERDFIRKLIAAGKTKEQIKDELVSQFGPQVLATPESSGFDLSAYLVPVIAFLLAVIAIALSVRRWRRRGPPPGSDSPLDSDESDRLDADLKRYDL